VPGVASVDVSGGVAEEVRVNIDLNRLQASGVGLSEVLNTLRDRNVDVAGGRILGSSVEPLTRTVGRFQDANEIANLSFEANSSGETADSKNSTPTPRSSPLTPQRVYLRDFAEVIDGNEEQRVFVALNGQPAVKVSIQKQPDANTVAVVDGVKKRLEALKQSGLLPEDLEIRPTLDESRFIRNSISDVTGSGIAGAGLAALSVLVFLGSLRQTFIISLTIPLCALAAAIVMKLSGFSLNVFSLGGLAISIGQAVDTSVVILENINKRATESRQEVSRQEVEEAEAEYSPQAANDLVEASSREVESSLVAATGANLVSVLPFVLVGGFVSLLFNELILTICFAVVASLVVAVTVVPMLSARLLMLPWSSHIDRFWLLRKFNDRFDSATRSYANTLAKVVRHRLI
ncbi:MAG TPA: efflux RND transporter permease subunit, partial [Candidatus Obscuribacterales bacterium]